MLSPDLPSVSFASGGNKCFSTAATAQTSNAYFSAMAATFSYPKWPHGLSPERHRCKGTLNPCYPTLLPKPTFLLGERRSPTHRKQWPPGHRPGNSRNKPQSRWTARPTSEVTRQGKPKLRLQVLPALQLEEIGARSENLGLPKINLATVSAVDCISSGEDFGCGKFHRKQ